MASFMIRQMCALLWRAVFLDLPRLSDTGLKLCLAGFHPRGVVLLGDLYAAVAQQNGNLIDGNAGEKQFDGKCVAEHVRETSLPRSIGFCDISDLKEPSETPLPVLDG